MFVLSGHCTKLVSVVSPVSLSRWAETSSSSDEGTSEYSSIKSVLSQSKASCSQTAQCTSTPLSTHQTQYLLTECDSSICTAWLVTCYYCSYMEQTQSGIPRNFVRGGFNKFSWGQRTERTGIWGR